MNTQARCLPQRLPIANTYLTQGLDLDNICLEPHSFFSKPRIGSRQYLSGTAPLLSEQSFSCFFTSAISVWATLLHAFTCTDDLEVSGVPRQYLSGNQLTTRLNLNTKIRQNTKHAPMPDTQSNQNTKNTVTLQNAIVSTTDSTECF